MNGIQNLDQAQIVLAVGIPTLILQASKMNNNKFWKIVSADKNGAKFRIMVGSLFLTLCLRDISSLAFLELSPSRIVSIVESLIYHYI